MFVWGWTPYVDPDPQLAYFTCDQIASDPDDPLNYYNDANFCDPEYDKLYQQQKVELDPEKRIEIVHEMLRRFYSQAVYLPLYNQPDLQAYRKDRFEGWQRQPAETGPVLFSNTSPSYATLKLDRASSNAAAGGGSGDDGGGSAGLIAGIVIGWSRSCGGGLCGSSCAAAPPTSASEHYGSSSRKVLGSLATLAFVVVFNFFLFRVVASDPVATLFRGRNLTDSQRDGAAARVRARRLARSTSSGRTCSRPRRSTSAARTSTNEPVIAEIAEQGAGRRSRSSASRPSSRRCSGS